MAKTDSPVDFDGNPVAPENRTADDDWERVEVGFGEAIDLSKIAYFQGTFRGLDVQHDVDRTDGTTGDVEVFKFHDVNGEPCFIWYTYELKQALTENMVGREVRIQHMGKQDIGGGRTLNKFKVMVRKQQ